MCDYLDNYKKIVTVEDILAGKVKLVKDFKINDHNALIERFKQANLFSKQLSNAHLENIAKYFLELPSRIGHALLSQRNLQRRRSKGGRWKHQFPVLPEHREDLYQRICYLYPHGKEISRRMPHKSLVRGAGTLFLTTLPPQT